MSFGNLQKFHTIWYLGRYIVGIFARFFLCSVCIICSYINRSVCVCACLSRTLCECLSVCGYQLDRIKIGVDWMYSFMI